MASRKNKPDITIESLLRLKRNERPGGEFWDSFEEDFQRRRLNSLVEQPSMGDSLWSPGLKALVFGLPALLLVALTVLWAPRESLTRSQLALANSAPALVTGSIDLTEKPIVSIEPERMPAVSTSMASSQFVVDAIENTPSAGVNFRKVLYTPAISLSAPSGASYVRDSMSSGSYRVTTANVKLGRNF